MGGECEERTGATSRPSERPPGPAEAEAEGPPAGRSTQRPPLGGHRSPEWGARSGRCWQGLWEGGGT